MPPSSTGKFADKLGPNVPKVKKPFKPVPSHLNVQSDAGLQPLIDIDLKPNRDPTAKIYEPPFNDDSSAP